MNKLKILHIITSLHADGAQRVLLRLLLNLDRDKFDCRVINLRDHSQLAEKFTEQGIAVESLNMKLDLNLFAALKRLVKNVRDFKPDIIQGWLYHGNLIASALRYFVRPRPKVIWNIRRSVYSRSEDKLSTAIVIWLNGLFSKSPSRVIYCAKEVMQQHAKLNFDLENSALIPNGFDIDRYVPTSDSREKLRNLIGINSESIIIGSVGRNHWQKDYNNFINAAAAVHARYPNVHFVLIGRGLDKSNTELNELIARFSLEKVFHLLGQREEVQKLVAGFDIFCSSSSMEGFANVVGEAMACQVPCVVTDTGASRELVEGIGQVVPRRNSEQLAKALIRMLEIGEQNRSQMGELSRERIVKHYDFRNIVGEYQKTYLSAAQTGLTS